MGRISLSRASAWQTDSNSLRYGCALAAMLLAAMLSDWLLCGQLIAADNETPIPASPSPFLPEGIDKDPGWPFVRGPNYDGHSPEVHLADSWPEAGPPVLWTRELGQGYSSFVAWGDRVATQYQTLAGQYVICLDANSGETIWEYRYEWAYEPAGVYPGPRATPTYADGFLYFAGPHGLVGCLNAESGKLVWELNIYEKFGGDIGFGYSCSPTVIAGKVILPVGGPGASMVALAAQDGSLVWKAGDEPASYTPAYPISFQGRSLVLGYLQNALVCHDLESGEIIWKRRLSAGYDEHSAWPLYQEPYLWISSPFQAGSELLELTGDPEHPLKTVWASRTMSNDIFSSVLADGAIFGFDIRDAQAKTNRTSRGTFRCLDFLTGDEKWSVGDDRPHRAHEADVPWIGHAMVLLADDKLILLNDLGELILAAADPTKYRELGRVSILSGELCWTQPCLHQGRLFVRNQSRAACVFLGETELLHPQSREVALTAADIPQSQYVDWASIIFGVEPEYAFDLPTPEWLWRWYGISLAILGVSWLIASLVHPLVLRNRPAQETRWLMWTLAYVGGMLGTTLLSAWSQTFVFTWPISIFVTLQALMWEVRARTKPGTETTPTNPWRARIALLLFLVSGLAYFLVCRRLSLVFEWVWLCGYAGAIPFSLIGQKLFPAERWNAGGEAAVTSVAFSGFYWFAAAILWLR